MFTSRDIEFKTIFVLNCIKDRNIRVSNGEMLIEEKQETGKNKTLTKLPFQKILALFIVGHITITTPLIEKCKKNGVALVVVKPNWRPVFYWSDTAEANYLLRKKQYELDKDDITIACFLVKNKIRNQIETLQKTRCKDVLTTKTIDDCIRIHNSIYPEMGYESLMGAEGNASKLFFNAYYQQFEWKGRYPRAKNDELNAILDIGYTILFNYIECFLRMFGFDLYKGVFHCQWFKRKSLVCDIMEPFRCIIDRTIRLSINKNHFTKKDFMCEKGEFKLKYEEYAKYYQTFFDALIQYKAETFKFVQSFYRNFMRGSNYEQYVSFNL